MSSGGYNAPAMKVVRGDIAAAADHCDIEKMDGPSQGKRAAWEGSTRRERLPPDWDWRVAETFREYGDWCHVCGERGADEVDHVIAGDDHRLENLRPIHSWQTRQRCHVFKTAREAADARWRPYRPKVKHPGLL